MDSTGVTVAGQPKDQDLILRLRIEADQSDALLQRVRQAVSEVGGEVVSHRWVDDYVRLGVQYGGRDEALPYTRGPCVPVCASGAELRVSPTPLLR